jgi:hypothetical protein
VFDLVRFQKARNALWVLLFGPGYALLPTIFDEARVSSGSHFEITTTVRGEAVLLTTQGTDKHSKDEKDGNSEPINVCYFKKRKPS